MKKILLILLLAHISVLNAQVVALKNQVEGNGITLSSVEGAPGDVVEFELSVKNMESFVAFQTEIPLGDNLSYVENSAVLYRNTDHELVASVVNGTLKIYAYSLSNSEFQGNEGKIATFQLRLGTNPGMFTLANTKAKMVNIQGEELALSTVNGIVCIVTPKAEISTPNINYGHIPIRSSYTRSLTVKNIGNADLTIKELLFSDETLSCPSFAEKVVSAGSSTSFSIVYNPIEAGAVSYTVTVVSNAGNGNQKATITADPYSVNELHLDKVSAYCDSVINYNIKLNNMDEICGFQFCVKMPSALQYQTGSMELSSRKTDHIGTASMRNDTLVVMAYSPSNEAFSDNDGVIATLKIKIKGNNGYHYLYPKNTIITNAAAENVISDSYNGYVNVKSPKINMSTSYELAASSVTEIASESLSIRNNGNAPLRIDSVKFNNSSFFSTTEFPLVINDYSSSSINISCNKNTEGDFSGVMRIYSNDGTNGLMMVQLKANRYEPNELQLDNETVSSLEYLDVILNLNNYSELTAIQADFTFQSEYYTLSNSDVTLMERCSGFSKTSVAVNDNTFKILLFSMSNEIIEGNEGPVLKIRLRRKADATNETATVSMNNVVLSDVKGNNKNSGSIVSKNIELLSTHSIELKQGWNWYSTYIDINGEDGFSVLKDMLGNNAKIIKSQTEFALYYEEQAIWDGSLKSYDNKVFYMINTFNPLTLEMQGIMTDMSNYEIIIKPGWNWINYSNNEEKNLNEVDLGFTPTDGDLIKSQTEFAKYYEGFGWDGSLNVMKSGGAYMYYSNDTENNIMSFINDKK